jgi:hypothetical protein
LCCPDEEIRHHVYALRKGEKKERKKNKRFGVQTKEQGSWVAIGSGKATVVKEKERRRAGQILSKNKKAAHG